MTGYTNTNAAGSQIPPTGNTPLQSDSAAQGGYLGKAQGWTNRVTNNLQGQAEHLKGKFAGSGAAGQGSTTTGLNTTGTRTGYEPTGTGTGYSSSTGTGTTSYSDPNSGYSTGGNQPGVAHGHNAHLSQGYAPAQATSGAAADGTYGHTAAKPSYTDQAKTWTARVADNLHGQAEYLKNKVAGPSTTAGQPTGTGTGYSQGSATGSGAGYNQGSGTGYSQGAGTPGFNQGTHVGQTQGAGAGAGATPGYGQGADYAGAGQTRTHTGASDPQAKKSWTDTAKQGIVGGLGYTQSGLEYVKNKVAGPTGSSGTGNTGSSYSTGQPTSGTTTNPNQRY
ncbi:TPA: hypothetical protein ACH3X2_012452 [Trebouxia sp. C0005]